MNYLIVVAHPDDEILGAGASVCKWVQEGHAVDLCILCSETKVRAFGETKEDLHKQAAALGIRNLYLGTFPNIELNTVPHLHLVQFVEKALTASEADVIVTHHPTDTNNDHTQTALACNAAIRLCQRRTDLKPVTEMWYMEVLSSTEWNLNPSANSFEPNVFVEVGKMRVDRKIEILSHRRGMIRPYPHPRSIETLTGLAALRGSQAGCCYAEAFECVFRRVL